MRYSKSLLALALLAPSLAFAQTRQINDVQLRPGSSTLWGAAYNVNNNQDIAQYNTAGSVVDSFRWFQGPSTTNATQLFSMSATGMIAGAATGGRMGAGTINATGLYVNGVIVPPGGTPGGSSGQIQFNNSGVFGGFTTSGDATINTASGALTLSTVNANVGSFGSATACTAFTVNAKGLITAASDATCTPALASITGFGTGIAAALATNVGSAGAPVLFDGDAGTPSALVGTNITGTAAGLSIGGNAATATTANAVAVGNITGLSANCGTWLATASSANLLSCMTNETGTGALVFGTAPVFTDTTTVTASPGASAFSIVSADNNLAKIFSWRTSGSRRWSARVDGNETGGNTASNWSLRRYDDTGTFIDSVLSCVRSTGVCTFAFPISGSGASLTALNASNLSTGTLNSARLAYNGAVLQATPSAPTGTTSASAVMMGLGVTTCRFTPTFSTRVRFEVNGSVANTTVNGNSGFSLRYGTGAGPANGAAASGGSPSSTQTVTSSTTNAQVAFNVNGLVTGLVAGTTYWFDTTLSASAGTSAILSPNCSAYEF
jgi:hypothetical protein